jgi:hypothetical protein
LGEDFEKFSLSIFSPVERDAIVLIPKSIPTSLCEFGVRYSGKVITKFKNQFPNVSSQKEPHLMTAPAGSGL